MASHSSSERPATSPLMASPRSSGRPSTGSLRSSEALSSTRIESSARPMRMRPASVPSGRVGAFSAAADVHSSTALTASDSPATQLKRLGRLNVRALNDYIDMVEKLADSRLVEIRRLQGEMTKQRQDSHRHVKPKYGELFVGPESSDLPPKLRAIIEDNRFLKEKVHKYKARCTEASSGQTELTHTVAALRTEINELKKQLNLSSVSPSEIAALKENTIQLVKVQKLLRHMESDRVILEHKRASDARRFACVLKETAVEREHLSALIGKQREELKASNLEVRTLLQQLPSEQRRKYQERKAQAQRSRATNPVTVPAALISRTHATPPQSSSGSAAEEIPATARANGSACRAPHYANASRHCGPRGSTEQAKQEDELGHLLQMGDEESRAQEQAAIRIQATYRGHRTRQELATFQALEEEHLCGEEHLCPIQEEDSCEREQAATRIQASYRGRAARRKLADSTLPTGIPSVEAEDFAAQTQAATRIQAMYRGRRTRLALAHPVAAQVIPSEEADNLAAQTQAATRIQATYRGRRTRRALVNPVAAQIQGQDADLLEKAQAATRIQATYRGRQARRQLVNSKPPPVVPTADDEAAAQEAAATRIQATFRGQQARRNLRLAL